MNANIEIPVKKNKQYEVDIIDQGAEGEGIAKIDGFTIFIPQAIKGEKVKILIVKVLKTHAFGKILEIIKKSENRIEIDCNSYPRCGGCNLRHMDYESTLNLKQNKVENLVNKTFGKDNIIKVNKTIGMGNPFNYRNKAQYPFGEDKNGGLIWGVFAQRTHDIIPIKNCKIQDEISEQITYVLYQFFKNKSIKAYNEKNKTGLIRHVVIKVGKNTKEIMCIIVINGKEIPYEKEMIEMLVQRFPNIKTIVKNINMKNTNVILGEKNVVLYGEGYIIDTLGEYAFKISPMSFYQINPVQAELLYNIAIESANLSKEDILFDLYCGIGTIGIFAAKYVKKVYGIEIVEQAIEDAKENAKINNIQNIEFFAGDVEEILYKKLEEKNVYPDVVIVDPPRRGLDNNTIENLSIVKPKKIVYISCNPATLVRDIKLLSEKYEINEIQPVDLFPFTRTCGMCCGAISKRFDAIVEFTAFENFCSFDRKGKKIENPSLFEGF